MSQDRSPRQSSTWYRERADQAWQRAIHARTLDGREWWTRVAENWEELAAMAERQEKTLQKVMNTVAKLASEDEERSGS